LWVLQPLLLGAHHIGAHLARGAQVLHLRGCAPRHCHRGVWVSIDLGELAAVWSQRHLRWVAAEPTAVAALIELGHKLEGTHVAVLALLEMLHVLREHTLLANSREEAAGQRPLGRFDVDDCLLWGATAT